MLAVAQFAATQLVHPAEMLLNLARNEIAHNTDKAGSSTGALKDLCNTALDTR